MPPASRSSMRSGRWSSAGRASFPASAIPVVQRTPAARRLPRNPTDRWAACLALYLDARLRLLCGGGLSLLARPARIQVCDLDLKAVFALDHHPIELRIAGLDRNPGWSPAEGRAFAFVFA